MQSNREIIESFDNLKVFRPDFVFPIKMKSSDIYKVTGSPITSNDRVQVTTVVHKSITDGRERCLTTFKEPLKPELFEIYKKLDHPYIIKPFQYFEIEPYGIITESHSYNLAQHLQQHGPFSEKEAAHLCRKILLATNFLHKNNIMHRKISLENLALTDPSCNGPIKLSNFLDATVFKPDQVFTDNIPMNADYTAPEVLKGEYTEKCDVWSCGVALYTLLCGKLPYEDRTEENMLKSIQSGKYNFEGDEWKGVSEDAKLFIRRMMECDVGKRYSAREALNDPWLMKHTQRMLDQTGEEILKSLEKFAPKYRLQKLFLFFMTDQLLPTKAREILSETFDSLDLDHDGKLTRDDLITRMNSDTYKQILERVDLDKSGDISYSEFVMATLGTKFDIIKELSHATFALLDWDKDGAIGVEDLKFNFGGDNSKREIKDYVWQDLISDGDYDHDGKLNFEEFVKFMNDLGY